MSELSPSNLPPFRPSSFRTPLALFVYNRPAHTRRALEAISRMRRLDEVELTIFCDAPKHAGHAAAVGEVRAIARAFAAAQGAGVAVNLVERDENHGLARSIAGSVSALTQAHGRVIVLEDDLVPTPDFLAFMLDGLARYQDAPEVLQISGCLLPGALPAREDAFFLPLTTTWGWATWARAWERFQPVTAGDRAALDADAGLRHRFTAEGRVDYVAMLDDRLAGKNDSWGILWWHAVARAGGLVLYPRESLIWNGGFDASGVHCGGTEVFQPRAPEAFSRPRLADPIRLPASVRTDDAAWASVLAFLSGGAPRRVEGASLAGRLKAAARKLFNAK
jgi:hypothetical protein